MRISIAQLKNLCSLNPELKRGCIVDTNTLFATSVPLDRLNEWAESVFTGLNELEIPAFTNINIRSEFLDLHRRVLIPEGLVTLFDEIDKQTLDPTIRTQLKALKTSKDEATLSGKLFKFNDQQIKKYRTLLALKPISSAMNGWDQFCEYYLRPYIANVWEDVIESLKIQFVGTRAIENREYFDRDPNWKDMTDIIGRFGVGSSDAMIINFFLCSKFPLIVTGDEDVAYVVERLSNGTKFILVNQ